MKVFNGGRNCAVTSQITRIMKFATIVPNLTIGLMKPKNLTTYNVVTLKS